MAQYPSQGNKAAAILLSLLPLFPQGLLLLFMYSYFTLSVLKVLEVMSAYFLLSLLLTAQLVLSSQACMALVLYLDECCVPDTVLVGVLINHVHNGSCIQTIQHHIFEELTGSGITLEASLASKPRQHVASLEWKRFAVET